MQLSRRAWLRAAVGLVAACTLPRLAGAAVPTPRQTAGPFYPDDYPLDDDNDLVHVSGRPQPARGEVTDLRGRLLDRNGHALSGQRVEIWQCDANGRYRHSRDPGRAPIDPGFQGLGHAVTDEDGRYRFLTIRPVRYPGRTPHIHVAVYGLDSEPFVTQLYVAGEAGNAEDFLYRRIPEEQRGLVTVPFASVAGEPALQARWDIVLDT
ncbi:MAG: intradiol ring-cleavage dioxygenase [Chromatiaceae bacterium]|nr:intradiol ring-cleavage dioxygenase [Chromatiaceae bacterium]